MDIGNIRSIKGLSQTLIQTDLKKNQASNADRDADGRQGHDAREQIKQLTPAQEVEAVAKLNALPNFRNSGLSARIVRESGKAPHVVVLNSKGTIVRQLPYSQLIDLYLDRNSDAQSGRLLRRAA